MFQNSRQYLSQCASNLCWPLIIICGLHYLRIKIVKHFQFACRSATNKFYKNEIEKQDLKHC